MSQQQPGKPGAGGASGQVPMPFPLVQNISQLSELRSVGRSRASACYLAASQGPCWLFQCLLATPRALLTSALLPPLLPQPPCSGMPAHVLANPAMALAAQQLVAQRLLQQQMIGGGVRPMMPAQMLALQAQQAQLQRMAAAAAPAPAAVAKKGAAGGTRKRGRAAAAPAAAPAAAAHGGMAVASGVDPGGALVRGEMRAAVRWVCCSAVGCSLLARRHSSAPPC